MRRLTWLLPVVIGCTVAVTAPAQTPARGMTVFEGARVIAGDGRPPIDNASFVVDGARFVQVGRAADVKVPAGAARINLAGKTAMPAIIDTHTHLSQTRNGAQFLKLSDTGTIEANKSADFLVPDANPLDDISNTRRISSVYLRGAAVDRSSYR